MTLRILSVPILSLLFLFVFPGCGDDDGYYGGGGYSSVGVCTNTNQIVSESGKLTAGEWIDNQNWDFWTGLFSIQSNWNDYQTEWGLLTADRFSVQVSCSGEPVSDAHVVLVDNGGNEVYRARTRFDGTAYLFKDPLGNSSQEPYSITASNAVTNSAISNLTYPADSSVSFIFGEAAPVSNVLDLMFMIDTTGSMFDELSYIKTELQDVIQRIKSMDASLSLRLSCNFYRDTGDAYVVRSFAFTTSVDTALSQLLQQSASGGGDYPEAVDQALVNAIDGHQWSQSARARILFLVLDAPPHWEKTQVVQTVQNQIIKAAAAGIRIIPVASSGVDKQTEFLLRVFGIMTGGSYVFLTDDSGIGYDHIEPTIGQFQVKYLNDLLVEIVKRHLGME